MGLFSFFAKKNVVAPGSDCASIAQAVASAKEGDTITVKPGVYQEDFVIEKNVTIAGVAEKDGSLPVIQGCISAKASCQLSNVKIQKSPAHGIDCTGSCDVKLKDCEICENGKYGVSLKDNAKLYAENCKFHNDGEGEVFASGNSSISLKKCSLQHPDAFIKSCRLVDSCQAEFKGCHLSDIVNEPNVMLSISNSEIDDGINSRDAFKVKLKDVTVGGKLYEDTESYLRRMHDEFDDVASLL